jgi:hypothetical protein
MAEEQAVESLRDTLDAVIEEVEQPPQETAPSEPAPAEPAPAEEAPAEPVEAKTDEPVDEVPVLGEKPADKPPASWKGDAKKVWGELPEAARNEVVRRERQVETTLRETAQTRQFAEQFVEVANTYEQRLRQWGVQPAQAFKTLMEADRALVSGDVASRAQSMARLIKDYNIDIAALDSALAGQPIQGQQSPDMLAQVRQMLAQELAPFKQQQQAVERQQQEEVAHTIESMAADHVNFPYFEDVREDMADLIELKAGRGVYITLQQAYATLTGGSNAVAANQQRTQALSAHAVAQKAKNAAASVAGSPASVAGGADPKDLRASIAAAIDGARV